MTAPDGSSTSARCAVAYPGPEPGCARARVEGGELVLENDVLTMRWSVSDGCLRPAELIHRPAAMRIPLAGTEAFCLLFGQTPLPGALRVPASSLRLCGPPQVRPLPARVEAVRLGDRFGGWSVVLELECAATGLRVDWRAELRDGAHYFRQHITLRPYEEPVEVEEIIVLDLPLPGSRVAGCVDGSPVVADGFFVGVEHPASLSTVSAEGRARCRYPCHLAVSSHDPLALSAVVGVVPPSQQRRAFLCYLERERAQPYRPFLHHNNGEEIALAYYDLLETNPAQAAAFRDAQESHWQELMERVGEELVARRGVRLDAFVHDYGWDEEERVWQFHRGFPDGFRPLMETTARYGAALGVWFSPWGGYPCQPARVAGGREQGLETNQQVVCTDGGLSLAGPRYYGRFRAACAGFLRDHGVRYLKFDGFAGSNSPSGAGEYRSDVEALWRLLGELRAIAPDVFINTSSGSWPSPFWLLRSDAIWRGGGDAGLSGAQGSERQQWITYRDHEVHARVLANGPLFPISSLMTHGVMINRGGRVKSFAERDLIDEIRSFSASGVNTQELYLTPDCMTPAAWDALAECAAWSRANADALADVHWVGGDPGQGQVYGWAAWTRRKGILALRNPTGRPAEITIDIADAFELPDSAPETYSLRSPWRANEAIAPLRLNAGQGHRFVLEPFAVAVFDAEPEGGQGRLAG